MGLASINVTGDSPINVGVKRARPTYMSAAIALRIAAVATAYVAVARIGLTLDAVEGFAALVWPPSGIALAALLLGGYRLWPAIAIAAFVTNFWAGAPVAACFGIAAGNTIEAILGAYLMRRVAGFQADLGRMRDVLALIVLAAGLSTVVSATIGVSTLSLAGVIPSQRYLEAWRAWWLGDAIGDLLIAPLILVWAAWSPRRPSPARFAEAGALGLTLIAATMLVFGVPGAQWEIARAREYILFPPLIWAALRFSVRGVVTSVALVMIAAVAQTYAGRGPFVWADLHRSLFELQAFMGISGATFLLLGASISERRRAARELRLARETAETANRAKAQFLAVVSHELRTPLNAITGYVSLLTLELDGPLTEKQRAVLERISSSQRHLLALIEDVLGFAQVEAGRLSISLQSVDVATALSSVEPLVATEINRRQLTLDIARVEPELCVQADPHRLRQVLLN